MQFVTTTNLVKNLKYKFPDQSVELDEALVTLQKQSIHLCVALNKLSDAQWTRLGIPVGIEILLKESASDNDSPVFLAIWEPGNDACGLFQKHVKDPSRCDDCWCFEHEHIKRDNAEHPGDAYRGWLTEKEYGKPWFPKDRDPSEIVKIESTKFPRISEAQMNKYNTSGEEIECLGASLYQECRRVRSPVPSPSILTQITKTEFYDIFFEFYRRIMKDDVLKTLFGKQELGHGGFLSNYEHGFRLGSFLWWRMTGDMEYPRKQDTREDPAKQCPFVRSFQLYPGLASGHGAARKAGGQFLPGTDTTVFTKAMRNRWLGTQWIAFHVKDREELGRYIVLFLASIIDLYGTFPEHEERDDLLQQASSRLDYIADKSPCHKTRSTSNLATDSTDYLSGNDWLTPCKQKQNATVTFTLVSAASVTSFEIWNQNESLAKSRDVKEITILYSNDGSKFQLAIMAELANSNGAKPNPKNIVKLPTTLPSAMYWQIKLTSFWTDDPYSGLMRVVINGYIPRFPTSPVS